MSPPRRVLLLAVIALAVATGLLIGLSSSLAAAERDGAEVEE